MQDLSAVHAEIARRRDDSLEAVREYVRVPSFSDTGEGIRECAAYTRDLLGSIASDAAVVETDGWPVVLGTVPSRRPDAPTLIVYGLYDVTPTIAHEWTVDPLAAEIVDAAELGILPRLGPVLVGRGVNNHKGPVLSTILALRALLDCGGELPINLVYVIEGEEEIGSPSLPGFIARHHDILARASGVWLPCMVQNPAGAMTLFRAYKGLLQTEVECRGGEWGGPRDGRHLWGGHAAWIDAPLMVLLRGLATLYDDQQHVTLDGLAELARPPFGPDHPEVQRVAQLYRDHPEWEAQMLANINVARMQGGKPLAEHAVHYMLDATLNIQGITGGYHGPTFYNHMPGTASAKLDLRLPPGISLTGAVELLQQHLARRGFDMLRLVNSRGYAGSQPLPRSEDSLLDAAFATAARYGVEVDVWPISNNCSPGPLLTTIGKQIPYSFAGLGCGDRPHAPDEFITIDSVEQLMHWTVDYLHDWATINAGTETQRRKDAKA